MPQFIATCPPGFEYSLVDELNLLGATEVREGLMQVVFNAEWPIIYSVCMWSRLANRILYPISQFTAETDDVLYQEVKDIEWDIHLSHQSTLAVDFVSRKSRLDHQQYGAQKIKDAIVDYFRENFGERPSVDTQTPDVRIHCRINKDQATLCIDLSGQSLHQRGYRNKTGEAPIKENFAALMLIRGGWAEKSAQGHWLLDPMCGSGTLVIEAAMVATHKAPGLLRHYWGFSGWKPFHKQHWEQVVQDAEQQHQLAIGQTIPKIIARDKDPIVLAHARNNATNAGMADWIEFEALPFQQAGRPISDLPGLIITNPPYGERMEEKERVCSLYSELGFWLKEKFVGDNAVILSAEKAHGHALGIRAEKIYRLNNGPIACELLKLTIDPKNFVQRQDSGAGEPWNAHLSEPAKMLANRIDKNIATLKSFIKQQNIECYRVYDADLPEYSAAIDVYQDCLHIQEYAPPKTVEPHKAMRRLRDIERVSAGVLGISSENVFVKTRMKQKGSLQYIKSETRRKIIQVNEGDAKFEVNLSDYLDTGLFPDHRKVRQIMPKWCSKGTRVLNLFCYTCTASVHMALAGAMTTNVDLSNTYLDWGVRNFVLNQLDPSQHQFIRDNCVEWLSEHSKTQNQTYDLIFIDPPTFSNSKKMEQHFDIQADHSTLIKMALSLLNPGGKLVFSNNFKKFTMSYQPDPTVSIKEITKETTSRDFAKKPLHRCWLIEKL